LTWLGLSRLTASLALLGSFSLAATPPKPCVSIEQAALWLNKDVCISAHVFDIAQLPDGTRVLDVCPPQTSGKNCDFTIVSLNEDRAEVGELTRYRDMDITLRGRVQPLRGRAGMMLSHVGQFQGGPPRFKPNPILLRGFGGDQERPPLSDPNLRRQGGRNAYVNTRDQVARPPP
jgi:hypothetical protein